MKLQVFKLENRRKKIAIPGSQICEFVNSQQNRPKHRFVKGSFQELSSLDSGPVFDIFVNHVLTSSLH